MKILNYLSSQFESQAYSMLASCGKDKTLKNNINRTPWAQNPFQQLGTLTE
jgi:hypothetical protein